MPVDRLVCKVAQAHTDGRASDAHRRTDRQRELGEDEDGDGGTELHRRSPGWRVVGDLVAHDLFNQHQIQAATVRKRRGQKEKDQDALS